MTSVSRRRFLQAAAALAAATGLPLEWAEAALTADPTGTTLDRTIVRLSATGYSTLGYGPGEPHIGHPSNPVPLPPGSGARPLLAFAHFTDVHIVDAQSPARVEFLDRLVDGQCSSVPVGGAWRPQETMTAQVLAAMVAAINDVQARRVAAGQPRLAFAMSTGDNCDNQQGNELEWFLTGFDGGRLVPNSGGPAYEGTQSPDWGDRSYWVPRAGVSDEYKDAYGFPGEDAWGYGIDGLLAAATAGFDAAPIAMPWYLAYGNHDGLLQGNAPANPALSAIATGPLKVAGLPAGIDPCSAFDALQRDPASLFAAPGKPVTADPRRKPLNRAEYVAAVGRRHGLELAPPGQAYFTTDAHPGFRLVVLDTVNPGGFAEGSIGQAQFDWLAAQLESAGDRYVLLFSHHGLHSLTNPVATPDPLQPDVERRVLADEVEALLHTSPNVIAWICGHTHQNRITLRKGANGHAFWDVETAAHIDWPCQARIVEVLERAEALLLRLTLVDPAGPVRRADIGAEADPVLKLSGVHHELAANDPQVNRVVAAGKREERNVVLTLPKPQLAGRPSSDRPAVLPADGSRGSGATLPFSA